MKTSEGGRRLSNGAKITVYALQWSHSGTEDTIQSIRL